MARSRVIPNLLYGALGLATVVTASYFTIRALRRRRARREEEAMMELRRSSRDAGHAKQADRKAAKRDRRMVDDHGGPVEAVDPGTMNPV